MLSRWSTIASRLLVVSISLGVNYAAYGQYVYVSNATNQVYVVNSASAAVVGSIPLGGQPVGLALTPDGTHLYVAEETANSVAVVDTGSNHVVANVSVGTNPLHIAITPNGRTVYVVNEGSNDVSAISTATKTVTATIPVGNYPNALATSPDGGRVYVINLYAGTVSVINTASNRVIALWHIGLGIGSVVVSPDGNTVYLANRTMNQISVCAASSGKLQMTIEGLNWPNSMAVSPNGSYLYVANRNGSTMSVINTSNWQVVATVEVGPSPTAVSLSADGSTAFVATMKQQTLAIVDTATNSVVSTVRNLAGVPAFVLAAAPPDTISGQVMLSGGGLGGVAVALSGAQSGNTMTDNAGNFSFSVPAGGSYVVTPSMTGYSFSPQNQSFNSLTGNRSATFVAGTVRQSPLPPPQNYCQASPTGLPPLTTTVPVAQLPQSCNVPLYPTPAGAPIVVTDFPSLQAAVSAAQCGDWIQLAPGASYLGSLVVPGLACPANNPVLVENQGIYAVCAAGSPAPCSPATTGQPVMPQWTNMSAQYAQQLAGSAWVPTLESATNSSPFFISDNASGWYFSGLEITLAPSAVNIYPIVAMGENTTTVAALPQNITFDRVLVHPAPCTDDSMSAKCNYVARGVDLNAVNGTFMFGAVWGIVNAGQDAQAIVILNSTGPGLVLGNYLEATGENLMFNTSCTLISSTVGNPPPGTTIGSQGWIPGDTGIPTCPVPSDFTVRLNHFKKQLAWQTLPAGCNPGIFQCYDVKNQFEVKYGQRILADSNLLDTTYAGGQAEFIISNCWATGLYVCQDLTFTNLLIEHGLGSSVAAIAGNGSPAVSTTCGATGQPACVVQTGVRTLMRNILAVDINNGFGQIQNTNGTIIDHNTIINGSAFQTAMNTLDFSDAQPTSDFNFQLTNTVMFGSPFNNGGSPGMAIGTLPSPTLGGDLFVGDFWSYPNIFDVPYLPAYPAGVQSLSANAVPPGQPDGTLACIYNNSPIQPCWALDWQTLGMLDFGGASTGADIPGAALSPSSPYHNSGTDGADVGANVAAILAAISSIQ